MLLIVDGRVSVSLRLPGDRAVEVATMGPGEVLGEIPLLDGGRHSATARATEPASLLSLSRADFAALVSRRHPTAFALKRRHRRRRVRAPAHAARGPRAVARRRARRRTRGDATAELEFCGPPDSGYVRRLATFRAFDSLALWGFLTAGRFARCPAGRTLVAEGSAFDRLLPDDERRGREGDRPRRPPHPRRAGRARAGVRLREPDRRRPVAGDRDHARADAAARAAAGAVRAALPRRGRPARTCSST